MTQQALRELVALAEELELCAEEHGSRDTWQTENNLERAKRDFSEAARNAIPHLKALLGEQREAQGAVDAIRNELMAMHDALIEDAKDAHDMKANYAGMLKNPEACANQEMKCNFAAMMFRRFNENIPAIISKCSALPLAESVPLPSDKLRGLVRELRNPIPSIYPKEYMDIVSKVGINIADRIEALLSQEPGDEPDVEDVVVNANVRCNACERSLVGVTTANAEHDSQCKPHGFACGLRDLRRHMVK